MLKFDIFRFLSSYIVILSRQFPFFLRVNVFLFIYENISRKAAIDKLKIFGELTSALWKTSAIFQKTHNVFSFQYICSKH